MEIQDNRYNGGIQMRLIVIALLLVLAFGIYHDGSSVGVRATYEEHIFAHLLQSSNKDVRRYIGSQMAQMTGAIGIGQAAGYKDRR